MCVFKQHEYSAHINRKAPLRKPVGRKKGMLRDHRTGAQVEQRDEIISVTDLKSSPAARFSPRNSSSLSNSPSLHSSFSGTN